MTYAAIFFFLISLVLGHGRLKELGRPYPALTTLGLMSACFVVLVLLDRAVS